MITLDYMAVPSHHGVRAHTTRSSPSANSFEFYKDGTMPKLTMQEVLVPSNNYLAHRNDGYQTLMQRPPSTPPSHFKNQQRYQQQPRPSPRRMKPLPPSSSPPSLLSQREIHHQSTFHNMHDQQQHQHQQQYQQQQQHDHPIESQYQHTYQHGSRHQRQQHPQQSFQAHDAHTLSGPKTMPTSTEKEFGGPIHTYARTHAQECHTHHAHSIPGMQGHSRATQPVKAKFRSNVGTGTSSGARSGAGSNRSFLEAVIHDSTNRAGPSPEELCQNGDHPRGLASQHSAYMSGEGSGKRSRSDSTQKQTEDSFLDSKTNTYVAYERHTMKNVDRLIASSKGAYHEYAHDLVQSFLPASSSSSSFPSTSSASIMNKSKKRVNIEVSNKAKKSRKSKQESSKAVSQQKRHQRHRPKSRLIAYHCNVWQAANIARRLQAHPACDIAIKLGEGHSRYAVQLESLVSSIVPAFNWLQCMFACYFNVAYSW